MRVGILSHNARQGDAIGNQLVGLVRLLTTHGWEARVFVESLVHLHPELAADATEHSARSLWRDASNRDFLCQADLVVAEYGSAYDLLQVLPALRRQRPRILFDYHGVTPRHLWDAADRHRLEEAERWRNLVWCADAAVVRSHFTAQELHQATGFPRERIHQIPCFVDTERFHPAPPGEVRNQLGLEEAFVLLFVGRLATNKRPVRLVEALAQLQDLPRPVHAVFIGDTSDIYANQKEACRRRALELNVGDRLHWLGSADEPTLIEWYRSADALVLPSLHEGFGIPVIEAMACGLPVVAARTTALPETLGDAGLSFRPDDPIDLTRQLRRVLVREPVTTGEPWALRPQVPSPIAILAPRFGVDFVGGAEKSLRTIAHALHRAGHPVEVFSTCTRHESNWRNELPAGDRVEDGILVHRFPVDPHDRARHLAALEALRTKPVPAHAEEAYLSTSLHSEGLIDALARCEGEFAALIVGPYLFGLTWRVAQQFGPKVLLLPCFHDEPFARLQSFVEAYSEVGGVLYHTETEQRFAQAELGINNPNSHVIGTLLEPTDKAELPSEAPATDPPYSLIYCGRFSAEKGVDHLLGFAERYATTHPERFRFVFMGQGNLALPKAPWLVDRGFVSDAVKQRELRRARALLQLSTNESLSLVALEAWVAGVPVLGHRDCQVLVEQIEKAQAGATIRDYSEFAAALDSLWFEPECWRQRGRNGQRFVREHYLSAEAFVARLTKAVQMLTLPLAEQMRRKGLERARRFDFTNWQARWMDRLTELLEQPRSSRRLRLRVEAQVTGRSAAPTAQSVLVPMKIRNVGSWPACPSGPRPVQLQCFLQDEAGAVQITGSPTSLPALLPPAQELVVVCSVPVPKRCGSYQVRLGAGVSRTARQSNARRNPSLELLVTTGSPASRANVAEPFLNLAQAALREAHDLQRLPDTYQDITQGFLARWKRSLKEKLLHQFRKSYVDVLSRQQTAFNEKMLAALCQLADGLAALGQAEGTGDDLSSLAKKLRRVLKRQRRCERRLADLEERVAGMEAEKKEAVR
jgi:glycosyltransferase involved in cell wall biosynthesis